jgi:hypothetical protein
MDRENGYNNLIDIAIKNLIPSLSFKQRYIGDSVPEHGSGYQQNYKIMLKTDQGKRFFNYFQGSALNTDPTLADFLYCLVSDHGCLEYTRDLDEFCLEFNYGPKQGKKVYKAIQHNDQKLKELGIFDYMDQLTELFQDY